MSRSTIAAGTTPTITKPCQTCGQPFETEELHGWSATICPACTRKEEAARAAASAADERARREKAWETLCPPAYHATDPSRLPADPLASCLAWEPVEGRGLLLVGASGTGKTRCAWQAVRKIHLCRQRMPTIHAMSEVAFSVECERQGRSVDGWLTKLSFCDLLFLDDIGHAATTARHLERLYYVVETRTSYLRPIVATTQFSTADLSAKAGTAQERTIASVVRRLREFCEVVTLGAPETKAAS